MRNCCRPLTSRSRKRGVVKILCPLVWCSKKSRATHKAETWLLTRRRFLCFFLYGLGLCDLAECSGGEPCMGVHE